VELQFLLNYIGTFYPTVPSVIEDGTFGATTKDSVTEFQRTFGLTPDGVVGPSTWNMLYQIYKQIGEETEIAPLPPSGPSEEYPGYLLRVGSRGNDVLLMQRYLNAISDIYPSIPKLEEDGIFGSGTRKCSSSFSKTIWTFTRPEE
jgi:peptidoglycan hydrolase-like protein with peptidoglycan-binding domain